MVRRLAIAGATAVLIAGLVGCRGPAGQPALTVENRDGPAVTVMLGSMQVAGLACGNVAVLRPGDPNVPPLPWSLRIVGADGGLLRATEVDAARLPYWIVIRVDGVAEGDAPVSGPAARPCASAAESFGAAAATGGPTPTPSRSSAPVGPSIEPVSASHPTPEAEIALEACGARDFGLDKVAGMGLVPRARDVPKYTTLVGVEPEIQTDRPAWVITFRGVLELGPTRSGLRCGIRGPVYVEDPTCVVIDGVPNFYVTGRSGKSPDALVEPPITLGTPVLSLPPLAP